jgi:hypothetical protein
MKNQLYQLNKLEEGRLIAIHHHEVRKQQHKSWNDCHIKKKDIKSGYLVLLYDS